LEDLTCVVCGKALEELALSTCQYCGGSFHQPWQEDNGGPCGQIISHSEALVLVFICNNCETENEIEE
jgi:hypothetical protein